MRDKQTNKHVPSWRLNCVIIEFRDAPQHVRHTYFIVCLRKIVFFPQWKMRLLPGLAMNVRFFGGVFKHHPKKEQTPMVSSTCFFVNLKGDIFPPLKSNMAPETGHLEKGDSYQG